MFRVRSSPLLHFLWHISDRILMIGLLRLNWYLTPQTPHTYRYTYILPPYRKFLSVFSLKSFRSESYLLWHILRTLHFCLQACFWLVAGSTDTFNSGKSQLWIYTAKCFYFIFFFKLGWSAVKTIFSLRGHTQSAKVWERVRVWWSEKQTSLVMKFNVLPS